MTCLAFLNPVDFLLMDRFMRYILANINYVSHFRRKKSLKNPRLPPVLTFFIYCELSGLNRDKMDSRHLKYIRDGHCVIVGPPLGPLHWFPLYFFAEPRESFVVEKSLTRVCRRFSLNSSRSIKLSWGRMYFKFCSWKAIKSRSDESFITSIRCISNAKWIPQPTILCLGYDVKIEAPRQAKLSFFQLGTVIPQ